MKLPALPWVNIAHEELNPIAWNHSKNLCDPIDGETIQKDAVHELDVCVLAEFLLQFRQTILVEAFDEYDA